MRSVNSLFCSTSIVCPNPYRLRTLLSATALWFCQSNIFCRTGDAESLHFGQQSGALEAQTGRRAFFSSDDRAGLPQSLQDTLSLHILQCAPCCRRDGNRRQQGIDLNLQNASWRQYHGSFNEVL